MFRGARTLNQRLSAKASDVYSSDDTDEEHDIASALAEAQRIKPASALNLNAAAMRAMRETPQQSDSFATQDDVVLQFFDETFKTKEATRKNVFQNFGKNVCSDDVFDQAAFSSSRSTSPRRVITMQPAVSTPPTKQSSRSRSPVAENELDDGHDSFDFSVVQFSPQQKKKSTLGKHFAATMSQSDLIHEGEGDEELSIAELSGQWQTMRQEATARNNALPSPPITPSKVRSGVLRQSSYDTPGVSPRILSPRSRRDRPLNMNGSRSVPGTPVTKTIIDSPTKRAHTTGTRKKRAIRLKASALGLNDGATAAEIKAALERVSPDKLKAALGMLIESGNDDADNRGRRRSSSGSKSLCSRKERSRSKGSSPKSLGEDKAKQEDVNDNPKGAHRIRRSRSSHSSEDGIRSKDKGRSHSSKSTKSSTSRRSAKEVEQRQMQKTQDQHQVDDYGFFPSPSSPTWSKGSGTTAASTSSDSSLTASSPDNGRRRRSSLIANHRAPRPASTANMFRGAFDD
ncbi:hypothetical protein MPSEU_000413100 [Mayamaea pseudoterrestris]|nr:hypothetical protein MPSEU_000413100 [Mayamaea pseudoterrestris]